MGYDAIASLGAQTHPFAEIIVVDDGSADDSLRVIAECAARMPNLRLIRHENNQGVVAAINTGLREAKGDFVFLCSANPWAQRSA